MLRRNVLLSEKTATLQIFDERMNSELPNDAMRLIEESKVILENRRKATQRRWEFLHSAFECVNAVIRPAAEEFVAQFADTSLKFEISGPESQLRPTLIISARFEMLVDYEPFAVEFRYQPADHDEKVGFFVRMDGPNADWLPISEFPLSAILRESVVMNLASSLAAALKRRPAPPQG